jgi:hypothetical protein
MFYEYKKDREKIKMHNPEMNLKFSSLQRSIYLLKGGTLISIPVWCWCHPGTGTGKSL